MVSTAEIQCDGTYRHSEPALAQLEHGFFLWRSHFTCAVRSALYQVWRNYLLLVADDAGVLHCAGWFVGSHVETVMELVENGG